MAGSLRDAQEAPTLLAPALGLAQVPEGLSRSTVFWGQGSAALAPPSRARRAQSFPTELKKFFLPLPGHQPGMQNLPEGPRDHPEVPAQLPGVEPGGICHSLPRPWLPQADRYVSGHRGSSGWDRVLILGPKSVSRSC